MTSYVKWFPLITWVRSLWSKRLPLLSGSSGYSGSAVPCGLKLYRPPPSITCQIDKLKQIKSLNLTKSGSLTGCTYCLDLQIPSLQNSPANSRNLKTDIVMYYESFLSVYLIQLHTLESLYDCIVVYWNSAQYLHTLQDLKRYYTNPTAQVCIILIHNT